jgi:hypothetical protein
MGFSSGVGNQQDEGDTRCIHKSEPHLRKSSGRARRVGLGHTACCSQIGLALLVATSTSSKVAVF